MAAAEEGCAPGRKGYDDDDDDHGTRTCANLRILVSGPFSSSNTII